MITFGPRGFLSNYPPDVVMLINGQPITRQDILNAKRERQRRQLQHILENRASQIKPCFIWVFYNDSFPYGGWWLYIRTLRHSWGLNFSRLYGEEFIIKAMALYPCGYAPVMENFGSWAERFAQKYGRVSSRGDRVQGMALARAKVDCTGWLLDIMPIEAAVVSGTEEARQDMVPVKAVQLRLM